MYSDLKEWPFPVDPTVARRVTEVSGAHDPESPCGSEEEPRENPYYSGYSIGHLKAEVVHYGSFFVPTGKGVFNCDTARTFSLLLPAGTRGILSIMVSVVVFLGAFGLTLSVVFVPVLLTLGGGLLLAKGPDRDDRAAGLIAALLGFVLAGTVVLAIATTAL